MPQAFFFNGSLRTGPYTLTSSTSCTEKSLSLRVLDCRADTELNLDFYLSFVKHSDLLNKRGVTVFICHWNERKKSISHLNSVFTVEKGEWRMTISSSHCKVVTKQTLSLAPLCLWECYWIPNPAALIQGSVLDTHVNDTNIKIIRIFSG